MMKDALMKRTCVMLFILVVLSACALPVSLTGGNATSAPTMPSLAATATLAPTLTATATALPPPTFTPTPDLRVITLPAKNFKLTLGDLPRGYAIQFVPACGDGGDPQCALASDRIEGPHLNYEVLQELGAEKGGAYINDTRRIEGWYIYYYNDYGYYFNPDVIMSDVIRFDSTAGARKYINSYTDRSLRYYSEIRDYLTIGDLARAYVRLHRGTKYVLYEFAYRNIVHRTWIVGTEKNITRELVQDLAFKVFTKLQAAELSPPPQFVPLPTLTPQPDVPNPDQRVISAQPVTLILQPYDLPFQGNYYLADNKASGPLHNEEIVHVYQGGKGQRYVDETGRVDGWNVRYKRHGNDNLLPPQMYDEVAMFGTAQGAQKHIREYAAYFLDDKWREGTPLNQVGDATRVFIKQDGVYVSYLLEFSYRNYVHSLTAYGLQAEVEPAFVELIAFTLLRNLQAAPLADTPK
jgi:hypothetical protein